MPPPLRRRDYDPLEGPCAKLSDPLETLTVTSDADEIALRHYGRYYIYAC